MIFVTTKFLEMCGQVKMGYIGSNLPQHSLFLPDEKSTPAGYSFNSFKISIPPILFELHLRRNFAGWISPQKIVVEDTPTTSS